MKERGSGERTQRRCCGRRRWVMGREDRGAVVGGEGWWREGKGVAEIRLIVEPNGIV
jgi:hypothetical protein